MKKAVNTTLALLMAMALPASLSAEGGKYRWEAYLQQQAAFDGDNGENWELAYDLLCELEANPININAATREELEQLPFLSDAQVEAIEEYVYLHGPVRTLGELMMIEGLDHARRQLLQCFVYAGEPGDGARQSLGQLLGNAKGELTATAKVPLYDRRGDRNGYLGYKYKHWMRLTLDAGDRLGVGLAASQDAGEPLFSDKNAMGYDFYSFYVRLGRMGPLRQLVAGRYNVSFGMGLVANTSMTLGKQSALASMGRAQRGIRATASRSAATYLQGVAATVALGRRGELSAFASYRPHDATLNDDGSAATIVTTGYHRTPSEMDKKNNTHSTSAGLNMRMRWGPFHAGATAAYTHYDRPLLPNTNVLYRQHYAQGSDFINMGVDYGYSSHMVAVRGETAINRHGQLATLNSIALSPTGSLSIMALQRFYAYRYTAPLANAFSEGGRVQNESGLYVGAEWRPSRRWRIAAYADYAWFAWARYQASQSSWATDCMAQATYTGGPWTVEGRYRVRFRQKDDDDKTALVAHTTHRARIAIGHKGNSRWSWRTQADATVATRPGNADLGYMLSHTMGYAAPWLRVSAFVGYFHTDSYDSRLYAYERGPLYTFASTAYQGHGLRYSLLAQADIGRHLTIIVKAGTTNYFDRPTISSGLQAIDGSSMTDIDVQAQWSF